MEIRAFLDLLPAVYDTLPTPVNLHRLGRRDDLMYQLCGQKGKDCFEGRYWQHRNKELTMLADILEQEKKRKSKSKAPPI